MQQVQADADKIAGNEDHRIGSVEPEGQNEGHISQHQGAGHIAGPGHFAGKLQVT